MPRISGARSLASVERVACLLVPEFSMMTLTALLEPLRTVNRLTGSTAYEWRLFSVDGEPVHSSSGISIVPYQRINMTEPYDMYVVCAGLNPQNHLPAAATAWLRQWAARGAIIGGVSTGSYLLAHAGLFDGYRCTIHWENMPGFLEAFPDLEVSTKLFEVDRNRFSCAGGAASLDLALHIIEEGHGPEMQAAVSEQFVHAAARAGEMPQRMNLRQRVGVSHPKLLAAIKAIEEHLDEPLSRRDLARRVGLSIRQLERLFRVYLGQTPTRYYLEARLHHARRLLAQTSMSVLEVALASGFASASHFAKSYRALFGHSPRAERHRGAALSRIATAPTDDVMPGDVAVAEGLTPPVESELEEGGRPPRR